LEDDGSDFDDEEIAMIAQRFRKFFKKARENSKKKNVSKLRSSDREQFTGCFKCEKRDYIVKNCALLKEEQDTEQFRNEARKQS